MSEFPSASLVAQLVKNLPAKQETLGSIPGLGRSPGRVTGYPFQYSCLETPTERSLVGYSLLGHTELNTTEWLSLVPLSLAQGLVHLRCPIKCLPPPQKKKAQKMLSLEVDSTTAPPRGVWAEACLPSCPSARSQSHSKHTFKPSPCDCCTNAPPNHLYALPSIFNAAPQPPFNRTPAAAPDRTSSRSHCQKVTQPYAFSTQR